MAIKMHLILALFSLAIVLIGTTPQLAPYYSTLSDVLLAGLRRCSTALSRPERNSHCRRRHLVQIRKRHLYYNKII